jgi:hypothetical protein
LKAFPQQIRRVDVIFKGLECKHTQKQAIREVYALVPGVPQYIDWSDSMISFDKSDHPDCIPNPGRSALVLKDGNG